MMSWLSAARLAATTLRPSAAGPWAAAVVVPPQSLRPLLLRLLQLLLVMWRACGTQCWRATSECC